MSLLRRIVRLFLDEDERPRTFRRVKVTGQWVDHEVPPPKFANHFAGNVSKEEIQLLFLQKNFVNEDAEVAGFFVVSPQRLVELQGFIDKIITQYEQHYGSLSPKGRNDNNGNPPPVMH